MKVLLIAGARPNFMKVAPLLKAMDRHNSESPKTRIESILVHTGQHYDARMSKIFFDELGIREPDVNLSVGSGTHAVQTANVMMKFEPVCIEHKPDWVVVVGDINSTVACTLVASKLATKVAHLEAGLRSFDRTMPEEVNRIVTDSLADLLLTPSPDADNNLKREGVDEARIKLVGNIMIDALVSNLSQARTGKVLCELGLKKKDFIYVTLHRPSNVDSIETLGSIMQVLHGMAKRLPIVFPVHPRTRKVLSQISDTLFKHPALNLIEPVGYHDSLSLTENARVVVTDSGGLQEEATFFRTPCLTLRPNTERPVTVTLGSNRLSSVRSLWDDLEEALQGPVLRGQIPPLWDGHTAERTVKCLLAQGT